MTSLLLPDDAVLLHIGLFKTGTTSLGRGSMSWSPCDRSPSSYRLSASSTGATTPGARPGGEDRAVAAEKLSALGVRDRWDVSTLGRPVRAAEPPAAARADPVIPVDAAREAVVGTVLASGLLTPSTAVESTSARDLLRVILSRGWRRTGGRGRQPADGR